MAFSQAGNENLSQWANYTQETSLQPFSVHYSANNEVNTASSHHSPSALLGQYYIPHPVSVVKSHNRTANQLKWNCIYGTVLVNLYSSHFAGEMVGENSSYKHFSQVIPTKLFYSNLQTCILFINRVFLNFIFTTLWVPLLWAYLPLCLAYSVVAPIWHLESFIPILIMLVLFYFCVL
jgi:hypothetical protein